jgi:hypothetical protein
MKPANSPHSGLVTQEIVQLDAESYRLTTASPGSYVDCRPISRKVSVSVRNI